MQNWCLSCGTVPDTGKSVLIGNSSGCAFIKLHEGLCQQLAMTGAGHPCFEAHLGETIWP